MFASFSIPETLQKRLSKFVLKRTIGQFLEEDIELDNLSVKISTGILELESLHLNVEALNDTLPNSAPVRINSGFIGKVKAVIPWHNIWGGSCKVEFEDLQLTLKPRDEFEQRGKTGDWVGKNASSPQYGKGSACGGDIHWDGIHSAHDLCTNLADSFLKEAREDGFSGVDSEIFQGGGGKQSKGREDEDGNGGMEGLQALTGLIETILSRIKATCRHINVRLEYYSPFAQANVALKIGINKMSYSDVTPGASNDVGGNRTSEDGGMGPGSKYHQFRSAVVVKDIKLKGMKVELQYLSRKANEESAAGCQHSEEDGVEDDEAGGTISSIVAFANMDEDGWMRLQVSGSSAGSDGNLDSKCDQSEPMVAEVFFNSLHTYVNPIQYHTILDCFSIIGGPAMDTAMEASAFISPSRSRRYSDLNEVHKDKSSSDDGPGTGGTLHDDGLHDSHNYSAVNRSLKGDDFGIIEKLLEEYKTEEYPEALSRMEGSSRMGDSAFSGGSGSRGGKTGYAKGNDIFYDINVHDEDLSNTDGGRQKEKKESCGNVIKMHILGGTNIFLYENVAPEEQAVDSRNFFAMVNRQRDKSAAKKSSQKPQLGWDLLKGCNKKFLVVEYSHFMLKIQDLSIKTKTNLTFGSLVVEEIVHGSCSNEKMASSAERHPLVRFEPSMDAAYSSNRKNKNSNGMPPLTNPVNAVGLGGSIHSGSQPAKPAIKCQITSMNRLLPGLDPDLEDTVNISLQPLVVTGDMTICDRIYGYLDSDYVKSVWSEEILKSDCGRVGPFLEQGLFSGPLKDDSARHQHTQFLADMLRDASSGKESKISDYITKIQLRCTFVRVDFCFFKPILLKSDLNLEQKRLWKPMMENENVYIDLIRLEAGSDLQSQGSVLNLKFSVEEIFAYFNNKRTKTAVPILRVSKYINEKTGAKVMPSFEVNAMMSDGSPPKFSNLESFSANSSSRYHNEDASASPQTTPFSATFKSFEGQEKILKSADHEEMLKFKSQALSRSEYVIKCHFPKVVCILEKGTYDRLYILFNCTLLWESAFMSGEENILETLAIKRRPSYGSEKFMMCREYLEDSEESNDDDDMLDEPRVRRIDSDGNSSDIENQSWKEGTRNNAGPNKGSRMTSSGIWSDVNDISRPKMNEQIDMRESFYGERPSQTSGVTAERKEASLFSQSGSRSALKLHYASVVLSSNEMTIQIKEDSQPDQKTSRLPKTYEIWLEETEVFNLLNFEGSLTKYLSLTSKKFELSEVMEEILTHSVMKRIRNYENTKRGIHEKMLSISAKIVPNMKTMVRHSVVAVDVDNTVMGYEYLKEGFWYEHIMAFLACELEPLPGYIEETQFLKLCVNFWDCALMYKPVHLKSAGILSFENLSISSNIVPNSTESVTNFVCEGISFLVIDNRKYAEAPESLKFDKGDTIPSLHDFWCQLGYLGVMSMNLMDISLMMSSAMNPQFEMKLSNDELIISVCADSFNVMNEVLSHFIGGYDIMTCENLQDEMAKLLKTGPNSNVSGNMENDVGSSIQDAIMGSVQEEGESVIRGTDFETQNHNMQQDLIENPPSFDFDTDTGSKNFEKNEGLEKKDHIEFKNDAKMEGTAVPDGGEETEMVNYDVLDSINEDGTITFTTTLDASLILPENSGVGGVSTESSSSRLNYDPNVNEFSEDFDEEVLNIENSILSNNSLSDFAPPQPAPKEKKSNDPYYIDPTIPMDAPPDLGGYEDAGEEKVVDGLGADDDNVEILGEQPNAYVDGQDPINSGDYDYLSRKRSASATSGTDRTREDTVRVLDHSSSFTLVENYFSIPSTANRNATWFTATREKLPEIITHFLLRDIGVKMFFYGGRDWVTIRNSSTSVSSTSSCEDGIYPPAGETESGKNNQTQSSERGGVEFEPMYQMENEELGPMNASICHRYNAHFEKGESSSPINDAKSGFLGNGGMVEGFENVESLGQTTNGTLRPDESYLSESNTGVYPTKGILKGTSGSGAGGSESVGKAKNSVCYEKSGVAVPETPIDISFDEHPEEVQRRSSKTSKGAHSVGGEYDEHAIPNERYLRTSTRDHDDLIEIDLKKINFDYATFPEGTQKASRMVVYIQDVEVLDKLVVSKHNKLLSYLQSELHPREANACMVKLEVINVRPFTDKPEVQEARMKMSLLPIKLNIDQDALNSLVAFFSYSPDSASNTPNSSGAGVGDQPSEPGMPKGLIRPPPPSRFSVLLKKRDTIVPGTFFQQCIIQPVKLLLDYTPKHLDYGSLREGSYVELLNLFHLEGSELNLNEVKLSGVQGWGKVGEMIVSAWVPHIRNTQIPGVVSGVTPVRSLVNIGTGFADLILLPLQSYQLDGKVVRGIQRGTGSFLQRVGVEAMDLGSKLAIGTQEILEFADEVLMGENYSSPSQRGGTSGGTSGAGLNKTTGEGSERQQKEFLPSKFAKQPSDVKEGISGAYESLVRAMGTTANTIIAVPIEEYHRDGAKGYVKSVVRAVPVAVLRPMIGASEAFSHALQGMRNQLDSDSKKKMEDKYKKSI
eukprot:Nk52_evm3s1869 gene=Nk52_evmTU3s1869